MLEENTMPDKIKILFLAANPVDLRSHLRLDEEYRQIREKLRAGKGRDCFELVSEWAVTPGDLSQVLLAHRPHILHFIGHGSKTQGIVLEDEKSNMFLLDKRALANLLKILKDSLRMVVLNACYSRDQAKHLHEMVDFTIGMNKAIGDEAAIIFASHFYKGLAFGRSVQTAFELGKGQLDRNNIPESNTPKLLVRYGVDQTKSLLDRNADLNAQSSDGESETTGTCEDRYEACQDFMDATIQGPIAGVEFRHSKELLRVIKDSPVRGKFSRREIRAAVQAVARRHGGT
jgi:CHAT domain-containing protein